MKLIEKIIIQLESNKKKSFGVFVTILILMTIYMEFSFQPGKSLFSGHDMDFHFMRLKALMEALKDGRFPVYLDYEAVREYGYPTKWFYPDLILVPFAFLGNLTDIVVAYKTTLVVMTVLCGIFMYITVNRIYKSTYIAAVSSLLYTFSFYRLQDLFERSALGETLSFTFVPIAFLGLYEIIKGNYRKWYILTIGVSLLICTHVLSMFLTCFTLLVVLLFYLKPLFKEPVRLGYLFLSGLVSGVLSAYFLYPLIEQMQSNTFYYDTQPFFDMKGFTITPFMIIWGFSANNFFPNPDKDLFLASMGILLGISICLRLFVRERSEIIKSVDIGVFIGILYILSSATFFPWDVFPFTQFSIIRFPWRLYEFASYFFAIAGGYYSFRLIKSGKYRLFALLFVIVATLFIIYNESSVGKRKFKVYNPDTQERTIKNIYGQGALEYVSSKVPSLEYPELRRDSITKQYKETEITGFSRDRGVTSFTVALKKKKETLELPLFYYKGYSAELNGEKILVQESKNGLLELPDVQRSGKVEVRYSGTLVQKVSPYISLISLIALCIYIYWFNKRRKENI